MNFLQLCQRTREKCGISGSGPAAVTGQSGEMLRVVNWVNEAWMEIQNSRTNWMWMRGEFTFNTVAAQQAYTLTDAGVAATHSHWWIDTLRIYRTDVGVNDEQHLHKTDYAAFRDVYQFSARMNGRPTAVAERPWDQALLLGPVPEQIYTVVGEYQKKATEMAANIDVPSLPTQYHMLIVYEAMTKYAAYEAAPEVMAGVQTSYSEIKSALYDNQQPDFSLGGPLA